MSTSEWTGRDDGPGVEHRRWHQAVTAPESALDSGAPRVGILGFASDEGVRRNQGRPGAAQAPGELRRSLAPLALHRPLHVTDYGDIAYPAQDLEAGHQAVAAAIAGSLDAEDLTVVLGGGHETAWGAYLGRVASQRLGGARDLGGTVVVNLDAHFDLRSAAAPTSGTPFLQMAEAEAAAGRRFSYGVLGIAEPSNTRVLFDTARELGVRWLTDSDADLQAAQTFVADLIAAAEHIHLEIDLDVLPASTAPGVSAPAALGVPLAVVLAVVRQIAGTGRLRIMDVAELNPRFDLDGRTAKAAARLITEAVHALPG